MIDPLDIMNKFFEWSPSREGESLSVSTPWMNKIGRLCDAMAMAQNALEEIETQFDHEDDAHKYKNGSCRCCIAEDALNKIKEKLR